MKALTVEHLIACLKHCQKDAEVKTGELFAPHPIIAVNIDDDGKVALISKERDQDLDLRMKYGNMVTPEGIQKPRR